MMAATRERCNDLAPPWVDTSAPAASGVRITRARMSAKPRLHVPKPPARPGEQPEIARYAKSGCSPGRAGGFGTCRRGLALMRALVIRTPLAAGAEVSTHGGARSLHRSRVAAIIARLWFHFLALYETEFAPRAR